jgi:phage terminase large subunit-like protein
VKIPAVFATVDRVRRRRAALHSDDGFTERGPSELGPYIEWLSQGRVRDPVWLEPLKVELTKVIRGEAIELCVSVPPRHGKSTTIHYWVAMLLALDPTKRVLYCSYDETFAAKNVAAIRALVAPPHQTPASAKVERDRKRALRELGITLPQPRFAGVAIGALDNAIEFTTAAGGCVRACGIQAPPTGEGYDIIIVDDPIRKMADAMSQKIRDTIGEGFSANLYTRRIPSRKTSFVIVATRWHEDDLTGRLRTKGWRVINLPAFSPDGTQLAPSMVPRAELEQIKAMNAFTWAALYMGDPSPRTGRLFGDAFFVEAIPADGRRVMGVDLAHSAKKRSDRYALLTMLDPMDRDGAYYVEEFVPRRGHLTDMIDPKTGRVEEGFAREIAARPHRAAMYTGKDEDLVLDLLGRLEQHRCHVDARRAINDKRTRAQPAATAWNAGKIRLPREPWAEEFAARVASFTGNDGDEDEEVDCLAVAFDMLAEGNGVGVAPPQTTSRAQRLSVGVRKRWT